MKKVLKGYIYGGMVEKGWQDRPMQCTKLVKK